MKNKIKKLLNEYVELQTSISDEIASLPLEKRNMVKYGLEQLVQSPNESELEEISYKGIPELKASGLFGKIGKYFKRFLTDTVSDYLIKSSTSEMKDTIQLINALDPFDLTGVFRPKAIYLGGGIDFATDAASWRTNVENFFGPSHVVEGDRLLNLLQTSKLNFQGLETPALLNPMRAETVRDEDKEFQDMFKGWKANELDDETFGRFQEKIREQIVEQDLYMLNVCDTNLINFDGSAGAGTLGEAQVSALKNQQVFIWLTNGMKISNISPWMMPSITKIIQDDELWMFLEQFK
tara:strand:+ start:1719 stop:2600 length:882 start_codon:yes stop_codon:yes gene_type:complete